EIEVRLGVHVATCRDQLLLKVQEFPECQPGAVEVLPVFGQVGQMPGGGRVVRIAARRRERLPTTRTGQTSDEAAVDVFTAEVQLAHLPFARPSPFREAAHVDSHGPLPASTPSAEVCENAAESSLWVHAPPASESMDAPPDGDRHAATNGREQQ